jgi:hypothetical protein
LASFTRRAAGRVKTWASHSWAWIPSARMMREMSLRAEAICGEGWMDGTEDGEREKKNDEVGRRSTECCRACGLYFDAPSTPHAHCLLSRAPSLCAHTWLRATGTLM